jgi:hypothetical protein
LVDSPLGERYSRFWAAYNASAAASAPLGLASLPLVMIDSGHWFSTGYVSFYSVYKDLIEEARARPAGAELQVRAIRQGEAVSTTVTLTNRSQAVLQDASNSARLHLLVLETGDALGESGRIVRAATHQGITSALAPGHSATYTLRSGSVAAGSWANCRAVVLVDYRPTPTGAYDLLQAASVRIEGTAHEVHLPFVER